MKLVNAKEYKAALTILDYVKQNDKLNYPLMCMLDNKKPKKWWQFFNTTKKISFGVYIHDIDDALKFVKKYEIKRRLSSINIINVILIKNKNK